MLSALVATFALTIQASPVPANQQRVVWLQGLDLSLIKQGWGDAHADRSVENHPITIGGTVYEHGVGSHAVSYATVDLRRGALSFSSDVGLDDETKGRGSVQFEVWADGKLLAKSSVMKSGQHAEHLEVSLKGARRLLLKINDGGDGIDYDHGDWANAFFVLNPKARPLKMIAQPVEPPMPIYMSRPGKPEINGPRVVGCTPGRPFLFKIPASGEGPLAYQAGGLPDGLTLDLATGIISGRIEKEGKYPLEVTVGGKRGTDHRTITLVCGDHKLALTPPMGLNSWNVWGTTVTADRARAAADEFVSEGLIDYGYRYVNIDDAWEGTRGPNGEIETNAKFGDMAGLAEYVHSKGLLLGIYSSPGPKTCAGYEASYRHEQQDASTYARWGVDYLKYDWCSYGEIAPQHPSVEELQKPYAVMRQALDRCDRDIVFSLCQYGMGDVFKWGKQVGGNLWRTTGDITDNWDSMSSIAFAHSEKAAGAGPGGWNDPDMLVVGRLGWGDSPRPTHLTGNEQITHITMWSLLAAPLILGCDLTKLDDWTRALITNREVIDIDQDPLGRAATRVFSTPEGVEVWSRPLFDGTVAVGLMNRADAKQRISVNFEEIGLPGAQPVRDVWMRRSLAAKSQISSEVAAHGAKLFRVGKVSKK